MNPYKLVIGIFNYIPSRICDDIVKYGHQLQDQMAVTGGYGDRKLNQKEIKDLKYKKRF